jgi:hypothetical protein
LFTFFALEKPLTEKGLYFYAVGKNNGKVGYFEAKDELNDSKVITKNNNNNFIILYNFQENPCCITNIFGNNFDIVIF